MLVLSPYCCHRYREDDGNAEDVGQMLTHDHAPYEVDGIARYCVRAAIWISVVLGGDVIERDRAVSISNGRSFG